MYRRDFLGLSLAALATPTFAAPRPYTLSGAGATITYTFQLNGAPVKGTVPIDTANLTIDSANLAASTADVTADVRRARTGLIFATEALKSSSVLNAAAFPLARFQSTRIKLGPGGRLSEGAVVDGKLTLRGATRPVRFNASLFRPRGTAPGDFSTLNVKLSGQVNRRDFGATGYADLVDNTVAIAITAEIATTA
ncbi:YceI family protein [uncultured Tateyamaria sp.]|uniref:YceI family protein n=1 Tax=uncultured Tateyamaria sp. TaxID=455651 RepID=UPI002625F415|nr:YceI family protein [uncultured Tateyamaria sp.]